MASLRQPIHHLTSCMGLSVLKLHKSNLLNSFIQTRGWLREPVKACGWHPLLAVAFLLYCLRLRYTGKVFVLLVLGLASGVMVIPVFTCLLTDLVGCLETCFQSLRERLLINPCHDLLCLLLPLKLLVSPKDLPSVTIHLLHFYAPQLSKHQGLNNPIPLYQPLEVPWGRSSCEVSPLDARAHSAALSSLWPLITLPFFFSL